MNRSQSRNYLLPKKGVHLANDRTWPCISIYSRKYTCRKVFSLRSLGRERARLFLSRVGVIILAQSCGGEGDNINLYVTLQGCGALWSQVLVIMCI